MTIETLKLEHRNGVDWLTLNRPDRLNAITPAMADELAAADCTINGAVLGVGAGELKLYGGWSAETTLAQSHAWSVPELCDVLADWAVVPEGRDVVSDGYLTAGSRRQLTE